MTPKIVGKSMEAGYTRDQSVFRDTSVQMQGAGFRLLTGPNGAGKSTLLEVVAGFLPLKRGSLATAGDLTLLRHEPALVPFLTLRDNVSLYLKRYRLNSEEASRLIAGFHLPTHLDKLPMELSTGTLRKAWLLSGLLTRSEIWCADEPFNGLDSLAADFLATELVNQSANRMVLVVAHQPPEVLRVDNVNRFGDTCQSDVGLEVRSVSFV